MRLHIRSLVSVLALGVVVAIAGCESDSSDGTSDCSTFLAPAVVGHCERPGSDDYGCTEIRETITPADAETICTQTLSTWYPGTPCPTALRALPACAFKVGAHVNLVFGENIQKGACESDGDNSCYVAPGTLP